MEDKILLMRISQKKTLIFMVSLSILVFVSVPAFAGWLIYHKPAFKGKVIDAETKEPIEGAVVVVTYTKETMGIPHKYSSIIDVRETLTDKNGEFYIPSYTTLIQPLSFEEWTRFIILKPGYGSFPYYRVSPSMELSLMGIEEFFTGDVGKEGEIVEKDAPWEKHKVTLGIVKLPKLKTREEIQRRMLGFPTGFGIKELPLLYRAYEEEKKMFFEIQN